MDVRLFHAQKKIIRATLRRENDLGCQKRLPVRHLSLDDGLEVIPSNTWRTSWGHLDVICHFSSFRIDFVQPRNSPLSI